MTSKRRAKSFFSPAWDWEPASGSLRGAASRITSSLLSQVHRDATSVTGTVSLSTINPMVVEEIYPIKLERTAMSMTGNIARHGDGAVFGSQPESSPFLEGNILAYGEGEVRDPYYFFPVRSDLCDIGATLCNDSVNPSHVFCLDVDFIHDRKFSLLAFRENPFDKTGETGDTMVLWASMVGFKNPDLSIPGSTFDKASAATAEYLLRVAYAGGPSIGLLDAAMSSACGQPVTGRTEETILDISEEILPSGTAEIVVTTENAYSIPIGAGLRTYVMVGATLPSFSPLTDVSLLEDFASNPYWWQDTPGITTKTPDGDLFFPNDDMEATALSPETGGENWRLRVPVYGSDAAVRGFLKRMDLGSFTGDTNMAEEVWKAAGQTDGVTPEYDYPVSVNPAEFCVKCLMDDCVARAVINMNLVDDVKFMTFFLRRLPNAIPPGVLSHFAIASTLSEGYSSEGISTSISPARGLGMMEDSMSSCSQGFTVSIKRSKK